MAVSSTATTVSATGDGSTTSFAVSFPFQGTGATAELLVIERVIATGVETVKSFSTHYDVTGGNGSTGAVVFGSAPADTVQIHIRRNTTRTQTVDYTANDPFPADTHELALDRLAMAAHEIQEELDRSFKVSRTNAITTPEFVDNASARASKLLGFSSDGNSIEATTGRVNSVSVSTSTVGAGGSATGSASYTDSTGALALSLGIPTGATGATGSQGISSGLDYNYSTTTTDADPSAGNFRINGSFGAGSQIFIADQSAATGNPNVSAFILSFDDSTNSADRGTLTIKKKSAPENFATYKISGASTDATSYVKLAVTAVVSSGSLSNSDACVIEFSRAGNAGAGSGDLLAANNLSDLAAAATARTNLGLGSAAVLTAGTSANNAVQLNGSAELPAVSGANLTNLPVSDVSTDIRFIALQVAGDRIGISGDTGIADPFSDESDIDTSTSTNQSFSSSTTSYSPTTTGVGSAVDLSSKSYFGNMTANGGLAAAFDGTTSQNYQSSASVLASTSTTGTVGVALGSGNGFVAAQAKVYAPSNASYNAPNGFKIYGHSSATASGGTLLGSFTEGVHYNNTTADVGTFTLSNTASFENYYLELLFAGGGAYLAEFELFPAGSTNNMTLQSNAFTAQSAPSSAIIGVQTVETDSITINTDLTAEVSRDGGSNFTQCTLSLQSSLGATSTKYYESASTDISSQPSGTSVKYRIKTLNNKNVAIHGVALKWA